MTDQDPRKKNPALRQRKSTKAQWEIDRERRDDQRRRILIGLFVFAFIAFAVILVTTFAPRPH